MIFSVFCEIVDFVRRFRQVLLVSSRMLLKAASEAKI
jgi:hypothetical protein